MNKPIPIFQDVRIDPEVGQEIEFNGIIIVAEISPNGECTGCMFALTDDDNDCYHLECCRSERADENDVIYKKVER